MSRSRCLILWWDLQLAVPLQCINHVFQDRSKQLAAHVIAGFPDLSQRCYHLCAVLLRTSTLLLADPETLWLIQKPDGLLSVHPGRLAELIQDSSLRLPITCSVPSPDRGCVFPHAAT